MQTRAATASGAPTPLWRRLTRVQDWLLDLVFPPVCVHCGRVDFRYCPVCLSDLARIPVRPSPRRVDRLDGVCATGEHAGALQRAVQAFKYEGVKELAEPLAARLIDTLRELPWRIDVIAPVPLHANREAERGYNQSALLSERVGAALGIEARPDCLARVKATDQQTRLRGRERRDNVRGAFEASDRVKGLSVLLIDDVVTTGATLAACAAALRAKGASAVYGLAVSHA